MLTEHLRLVCRAEELDQLSVSFEDLGTILHSAIPQATALPLHCIHLQLQGGSHSLPAGSSDEIIGSLLAAERKA